METEPKTYTVEELVIDADGAPLTARFYRPMAVTRAHLVLHGATGVAQRFYAPFACWAAAQGIGVLTYDYRDFGASQHGPLRESRATMVDWGVLDQGAAEQQLTKLATEGPLWLLGHSLGGLTFAFRKLSPRFTRIATVGTGRGFVNEHPWSYRPIALAFWYVLGPIATKIAGYLPGRKILLGADLPAGVFWQWRRWCTSREFFFPDIGKTLPEPDFENFTAKIKIFSMTDDVIVTPVCVQRFAGDFPAGCTTYSALRSEEFGLPALRHIEVFSARSAAVWPTILDVPEAPPSQKSSQ